MSIKRIDSQSYVQDKQNILDISNEIVLLKKSQKLIQSSKQKRPIEPDKLKLMRNVFTSMSNSQSMSIERLDDGLLALGYNTQKDISYKDFLIEHEINEQSFGLIDFEHFALLAIEYEEKLRIEEEALRRLDLKIAFECFDTNKDGMIDANELSTVMNLLKFPITIREANAMIEFADHDNDSLLSFDEFLTIFTQISTMNTFSNELI